MANLRDAKVVMKNAQALELFMRVSPTLPSFMHHFKVEHNNPTRLLFSYPIAGHDHPDYDPEIERAVIACEAHMQQLDISINPKERPEAEGLYFDINLADPRLKDRILYATAYLINARRQRDPAYTLSSFPSNRDMKEDARYSGYTGIKDKKSLQGILLKPFDHDVTTRELEILMERMEFLPSLFPKQSRSR